MTTILVTGATGNVGSPLTHLLQASGVRVRALVRDPERARNTLGDDIELMVGDLADPASRLASVDGVDAIFLACGNVPDQVAYECALIDAAAEAGVQRIVKLSAQGAAIGSSIAYWQWHGLIERHLHASGVPAVVLQPGFLMTNLLAAAEPVRQQGMLFAPAAEAEIAMIDPADVAAVAFVTLTEKGHVGHTHVLTGPEAITYHDVAAALSAATGRDVSFVDIPSAAAIAALTGAGLPAFAAEQVVGVFETLRRGGQAETTSTVHTLTGQAPRPFADFARGHVDAFRSERGASVSARA